MGWLSLQIPLIRANHAVSRSRSTSCSQVRAEGWGDGAPGVDYCGTTGGGGGFRVTADPLLFIYSVSRLFVQTYTERPRAITARRRATSVNSLRYTYTNNHFASFEIALLNILSELFTPTLTGNWLNRIETFACFCFILFNVRFFYFIRENDYFVSLRFFNLPENSRTDRWKYRHAKSTFGWMSQRRWSIRAARGRMCGSGCRRRPCPTVIAVGTGQSHDLPRTRPPARLTFFSFLSLVTRCLSPFPLLFPSTYLFLFSRPSRSVVTNYESLARSR